MKQGRGLDRKGSVENLGLRGHLDPLGLQEHLSQSDIQDSLDREDHRVQLVSQEDEADQGKMDNLEAKVKMGNQVREDRRDLLDYLENLESKERRVILEWAGLDCLVHQDLLDHQGQANQLRFHMDLMHWALDLEMLTLIQNFFGVHLVLQGLLGYPALLVLIAHLEDCSLVLQGLLAKMAEMGRVGSLVFLVRMAYLDNRVRKEQRVSTELEGLLDLRVKMEILVREDHLALLEQWDREVYQDHQGLRVHQGP